MHDIFVVDCGGALDVLLQRFPHAKILQHNTNRVELFKTAAEQSVTAHAWIINSNCDYSDFDFGYTPPWHQADQMHVWPTENQTAGGDTVLINSKEFLKQADSIDAVQNYQCVCWKSQSIPQIVQPEIFVWSRVGDTDIPGATVLRHIGTPLEMLRKTARRASTPYFWVINSNCDYSDFDFAWRPSWAEEKQFHVWPTENQIKGGDTYYVNAAEFASQQHLIESLEQYTVINWHAQSVKLSNTPDVVVWNFGGNDENLQAIKQRFPKATVLRYLGTHLEMVKKSVKYAHSDSVWILSDCCDYNRFDPAWTPDWETQNSIHCWASGAQKFGDTFRVPRLEFLQQADDLEKLEYYHSIVWHSQGYPRLPWPVNQIVNGDIYSTVKNHRFSAVYEYFVAPGSTIGSAVDPSLWEKRRLIAYNRNGHVSLCPRDAVGQISQRLLDYPYIQYHNCEKSTEKPQDIVFISYDEKDADLNYNILKKRFPQAQRVHGVTGNVAAYKAAAKLSETPWYYAVFPKTKIDPNFKFDHRPNYLETPGHYIFYAHNSVTDYAYGHGGVKLYHVKTTVEIENWGYDFTLSSPVTVVPVISCSITPATPYEAWRTSFREALKLKHNTSIEGRYRLHRWLTVGVGEFGEYSRQGAADAMEYEGDVKIANSWEWLREQFHRRYS